MDYGQIYLLFLSINPYYMLYQLYSMTVSRTFGTKIPMIGTFEGPLEAWKSNSGLK